MLVVKDQQRESLLCIPKDFIAYKFNSTVIDPDGKVCGCLTSACQKVIYPLADGVAEAQVFQF